MSRYKEIYRRNIYEIKCSFYHPFTFSLIHLTHHPIFDKPFAIITAYNPQNRVLSPLENRELHKRLLSLLERKKYLFCNAEGCYKEHCEEGFIVFNMTLEEALNMARHFDQYALFYNDTKIVKYIACEDSSVIVEQSLDSMKSLN